MSILRCNIEDDRIVESSGMAPSLRYPGLIYTIVDDPTSPDVFGFDVRTGKTMTTADLNVKKLVDTESIAMDDWGYLYVGATGDNDDNRKDRAVYVLLEPTLGKHKDKLPVRVIPIHYPDKKSRNAEGIMVKPGTRDLYLCTKGEEYSKLYRFKADGTMIDLGKKMPKYVTDCTFVKSGKFALFPTKKSNKVYVYETKNWTKVKTLKVKQLQQIESICMDPETDGTRFLIGSEGKHSPVVSEPLPKEYR